VAEGGGLLNRCTGQNLYPGFESLPHRQRDGVRRVGALAALSVAAAVLLSFTFAPHGSRVHAQGITAVSQFAWFDRTGKRLGTFGELSDYLGMELSHDGKRLAVPVLDPSRGTHDIWVFDVATGRRTQLTSDPGDENFLIWSPDDRRVVFNSTRRGGLDLFQTTSAGGGTEEVLLADGVAKWPVSWSPDGRNILYVTESVAVVDGQPIRNNDIWVLPLFGDRKPYPLLATPATEYWPAFSPDGKWIAYSSTESGESELYVMQFPPTGNKWQISSGGGFQARWRRDGKELFYLTQNRTLMAATVNGSGSSFEVRARQVLFDTKFAHGQYHAYDVSADGQRVLINTAVLLPSGPATNAELLSDKAFQLTSLIARRPN
jgi:dipeptidyl aminopeptidase/acylaminoacyl peptidase